MPPTPKTAIVAPVSTWPDSRRRRSRSSRPQPITRARSNGTPRSMGIAACSRTTVCVAKTEALAN
jgi:hypothetical protein